MNKQVRAALGAVRDFISGNTGEAQPAEIDDRDSRKAIADELLAAMSPRVDSEQITAEEAERLSQEQTRSRQLFIEHGYFDQAVQDLRTGKTPAERAAAARSLGLVGNQRATTDLIAAMFDDDVEVRNAAGEALAQIGDPSVSQTPANEVQTTPTESPVTAAAVPTESIESEGAVADSPVSSEAVPTEVAEPIPAEEAAGEITPESESPNAGPDAGGNVEVDDEQLVLQEHGIQEDIERYQRQLVEAGAARQKAENEARWRSERETKIRAEAEMRRVKEEELRRGAEEEASKRRAVEAEALAAESAAREEAEAESHSLAEEEISFRLEVGKLKNAAGELARRRWQMETARREAAQAAQQAEAKRAREEAEQRHQQEITELQNAELALRIAIEETATRRAELEASRQDANSQISTLVNERNALLAAAEAEIKLLQDEKERLLAAENARRAEAERLRKEAHERKRTEESSSQQELDLLNQVTSEVSKRRAEVAAAREKAERDAEELAQALTRMRSAEDARARAEHERQQVEAATKELVEKEERLLAEARTRAAEEQARLEEERVLHEEAEEQRLAALEAARRKTEAEAKQRAEREKKLHGELDHMRIADAEVRRRIEDAETLRRTAEQAYRVAAEKVQRIEAEAHAAAQQEEQIMAKLESVRRAVAAEAQARSEQEKRIKAEIEQFHRLENEERPRLEAAVLQKAEAVARLQQLRETAERAGLIEEPAVGESTITPAIEEVRAEVTGQGEESDQNIPAFDEAGIRRIQPAIGSYLNSVDPYKRAAGVTELVRLQGKDAFPSVVACFDDHAEQVRNAAARALCQIEPARTVDFFNRALEDANEERRRNIGSAIATSGLAAESIDKLASESREETYSALSILFVMAKTGEVKPLVRAVEEHQSDEVSRAVFKLLTLSGQKEIADAAASKRTGHK
jgi:HEAT repeats